MGMLTGVTERRSDEGQYGPCRPCRCLLCPCFPLVFSHHLTRVPAREEVREGGGIEGRELHLKTLELAAWGCGAWRGTTFPKPAAFFSLLTPFSPPPFSSHLPGMASREWARGVSSARLHHASGIYESGYTSMCGLSAWRNGECTPWSWDMGFVRHKT